MPTGVYPRSEEYKKNLAERMRGNKLRLGIPHTEITKKKLSEFQKVTTNSGRFKKGQASWNKGIPMSKEAKKKLSEANKGKWAFFKGKKLTKEHKDKISKSKTGVLVPKLRGENNPMFGKRGKLSPNYIDGSSTKAYGSGFTKRLKNKVRKRDNNQCQICQKYQEAYLKRTGMKFPVHHIDYDKDNHNINNLVTLCPVCHAKTNRKTERVYWQSYFIMLLGNK